MKRQDTWLCSPEDEELFELFSWRLHPAGYLQKHKNAICSIYLFHRLVATRMGIDLTGKVIDHIDRNPLNNQRHNLRVVTNAENQWNKALTKPNTSGFCGVSLTTSKTRYRAQIVVNDERVHLGYFTTDIEAAIAYDHAAMRYHREFAYTNFTWRIFPQWLSE